MIAGRLAHRLTLAAPPSGRPWHRPWPWVVGFGASLLFLVIVIRPFSSGPVAYDAAASVLYFQRIVDGQRLETFVNTTPKPLLTLVYGSLYALTHDWRAVSLAAIVVAAGGAAIGARLAFAVAGPLAALATGVFLTASGSLLVEVSWAYGLPWAIACWMLAGLALSLDKPRYGVAGVALMLGALARTETFLLIAVATVVVGSLVATGRAPGRSLLILVAWAALPIASVHDLLLTGDPLFWTRVSAIGAEGRSTRSVRAVLGMDIGALIGQPLLTLAAAVGLAALIVTPRGRVLAVGILTMAFGTSALLLVVALMHRQTLFYYPHPIVAAVAVAAAIGIAHACTLLDRELRNRSSGRSLPAGGRLVIGGLFAATLFVLAFSPILVNRTALVAIQRQRTIAEHSDAAVAVLARLASGIGNAPGSQDPEQRADPAGYRILVPRAVQPRLALDLHLPMTIVGPTVPNRPTPGLIHSGQVVYHDRAADQGLPVPKAFEEPSPAVVDGVTFELVDRPRPGTWVWRSSD